jgi:hypothetical protein
MALFKRDETSCFVIELDRQSRLVSPKYKSRRDDGMSRRLFVNNAKDCDFADAVYPRNGIREGASSDHDGVQAKKGVFFGLLDC